MKRNDKRGISAIVATVLIIGITVGVIAIVGNFIIGMVQENLQEGTLCSKAATQILVGTSDGLTCYNSGTDIMDIQINYGSEDVDLGGLDVYFKKDGEDQYMADSINTEELTVGLTRILNVNVSGTDAEDPDSFAIAPIVGPGKKACSKSQYITVIPCN